MKTIETIRQYGFDQTFVAHFVNKCPNHDENDWRIVVKVDSTKLQLLVL